MSVITPSFLSKLRLVSVAIKVSGVDRSPITRNRRDRVPRKCDVAIRRSLNIGKLSPMRPLLGGLQPRYGNFIGWPVPAPLVEEHTVS